jgi:AcrR family transcriptional regulator
MDARVARSRDRVLTAAFDLLGESGVGGFSVDEVARRSGVAKTTIYRHWPSREALLADVARQIIAAQSEPDTGSLLGDITAILQELAHLLQTARWSAVLPSVADAAERDPEFAEIHGQIQRGHAGPLFKAIKRAVARGELPRTADASAIVSALIGPLYYRRWFSREPIDEVFVATIVETVVAGAGSLLSEERPRRRH